MNFNPKTYSKIYFLKSELTDDQIIKKIEDKEHIVKPQIIDFINSISYVDIYCFLVAICYTPCIFICVCALWHMAISYEDINEKEAILIMNEIELTEFHRLCKLCDISYELYDITKKVILNEIDFGERILEKYFIPYLKLNLTVDIVLDKINIKGIDNLTEVDKGILLQVK